MKENSLENKGNNSLEKLLYFNEKVKKIGLDFEFLIKNGDFSTWGTSLKINRDDFENINLKKELRLIDVFPVMEEFIKFMQELKDFKIDESLANDINKKASETKDNKTLDIYVVVSKCMDIIKPIIESKADEFSSVKKTLREYKKNYEIQKSSGVKNEEEDYLKTVFLIFREYNKNFIKIIDATFKLLNFGEKNITYNKYYGGSLN